MRAWFGGRVFSKDPATRLTQLRGAIDRDLVQIDRLIADQLDVILHASRLRRLEGSWRGLGDLVARSRPGPAIVVRVLSARWQEMARDLDRAPEFDQSTLFRLVYEGEFGQAGGQPFGLLLVDHEVSHRPPPRDARNGAPIDDITVMRLLAGIAAAAFVPMVLAASPVLFGADTFANLALSYDVAAILDDDDHARWRALGAVEDSRFLCVTLPRVLARPRWNMALGGGWYEEHAPDEARRCWSVAGYALAANVLRAHAADRWPADIRGVSPGRVGGGLVTGLVADPFSFGATTSLPRASTDLCFTDGQERALIAANMSPLNMLPYGEAVFGATRSLQASVSPAPGRLPTPHLANRRIASEINAMLCVSRFAHYVKIIGRDLTGRYATASEVERRLQDWLRGYTNASVSPDATSRARYPLLSAQVQVSDNAGRLGSYGCVLHLQPYYRLDDVSAIFRLSTFLPLPGDTSQQPITAEPPR